MVMSKSPLTITETVIISVKTADFPESDYGVGLSCLKGRVKCKGQTTPRDSAIAGDGQLSERVCVSAGRGGAEWGCSVRPGRQPRSGETV